MDMVQTKLAVMLAAAALLCPSCVSWERIAVNGHMTGVTALSGADVDAALGTIDSVYHSPSGRDFASGTTTAEVARAIIGVQPEMVGVKEVIGHSDRVLTKRYPGRELPNWASDTFKKVGEKYFRTAVDVAFVNMGGIRVDMPQGDILVDDMLSMFPFHNKPVLMSLKGEDLLKIFQGMALGRQLAFSGAEAVVSNKALESLTVGGEAVDPGRVYKVLTIDFLLEGGDGYSMKDNALEIKIAEEDLKEYMVDYLREFTAAGGVITAERDGRYINRNWETK